MIKLLFIEDDKVDQISFKRFVKDRKISYDYTIISSILEAKSAIYKETYDIIITDYLLSDGTAFDIFDMVKGVPIIVITGHGNEAIAVKAIKNGAYDYLVKDSGLHYLEVLPVRVKNAIAYNKYDELKKLNTKLSDEITKRKEVEKSLIERIGITTLMSDIGIAVIKAKSMKEILHCCSEILVEHLDAAFVRIWALNEDENILELQASAGMYTHIDGQHSRIPVGQFKVGRIAQEKKPLLTNTVIGDPGIHDQEWAKSEGMIAFAGYPLLVEDQLVGVIGIFARKELTDYAIQSILLVLNNIGVCLERKRMEKKILDVAEDERQRIGRDLHDSLGQHLTGISFKSKMLYHNLHDKCLDESRQAAEIETLINDAINETRTLAKGALIMANDDESIITVLKELALNVERIYGIPCSFNYEQNITIRDHSVVNHLYRIAQEAVNNSIKHANAESISIDLISQKGKTVLKVKDDGIGIADLQKRNKGIGLRTMRYRANIIGASFDIEQNPNGGTDMICFLRGDK